jgi:cell filamentation protein
LSIALQEVRETMSKLSGLKYASSESDAYQPGSRKRVLRNLKGITRMHSVEDEELAAYMKAERMLAGTFTQNHRFRASDICHINKTFLGEIYSWAGSYRDVNLSKGGFTFATAMAIPCAMKAFERNILARQTPCSSSSGEDLASRLAIVHVELLLIHPFREGNGRTARLLATLMAYQAGMPGLDFGFVGSRLRS